MTLEKAVIGGFVGFIGRHERPKQCRGGAFGSPSPAAVAPSLRQQRRHEMRCALGRCSAPALVSSAAHRRSSQRHSSHRRALTITAALAALPALPAAAPEAAAAAAAAGAGVLGLPSAAALAALLQTAIDPHVLGACLGASFKLSLVCVLVGWLLKTKQIPNNTATVLSKVSFTLLIPCMLFTKVASTLAAQPDPAILAAISCFTLAQIAVGALLGEAVAPLVDRLLLRYGSASSSSGSGGGANGLQPLAGAGASEEAGLRPLVTLACSFGSSFTLPAVFFSTMLPAAAAERALGYTALIMLSWSPCLWSLGLGIVQGRQQQQQQPAEPQVSSAAPAAGAAAALAAAAAAVGPMQPASLSCAAARPAAAQLAWRRGRAFARRVLTPPFLAILGGLLAGFTPVGRALLTSSGSSSGSTAAAAVTAGRLGLAWAVLRSAMDVVKMLAGGTLAAQTVVLAASLLQQSESATTITAAPSSSSSSSSGSGSSDTAGALAGPAGEDGSSIGLLGALCRLLLPESRTEARALAIVSLTRFLLLPALTLGGVWGLRRLGLLPPAVAADPVLLLVLLAEAVMPSAQNLIILLQLSESTQALAPALAHMLLKLYAYSIVPVTLWVTGWATWLGVEVVC